MQVTITEIEAHESIIKTLLDLKDRAMENGQDTKALDDILHALTALCDDVQDPCPA